MTVLIRDAELEQFLGSEFGPVGRDLARRAHQVEELARTNASGMVLGIQSGDLLAGLSTRVGADADGLFAIVKTDSIHRGFGYPAFHDQRGRPWLTNALRDGFR